MKVPKKTDKANLERRRTEMFLLSLVLVLSLAYCAMEWRVSTADRSDEASIEDIIDDIDFDLLRRDLDMIAAVPEEQTAESAATIVAADEQQDSGSPDNEAQGEGDEDDETEDASEELLAVDESGLERQVVLERLPEFPGGASAFMKWITANVKYPKSLQTRKISGTVVVSFVIDAEGNATQLAIDSSDNKQLAQAVLNVMRRMPKWRPGIQNGNVCPTMIKVPINFEL